MPRKEPTPVAKREVTIEETAKFLAEYYLREVSNVEGLEGGKHSKAFSYTHDGHDFIIRFNVENRGFLKDKFAFLHFGDKIPIPKIIDLNTYEENMYFCITEKATGETARDQYKREDFSFIPLLYDAIENIAKIGAPGTGYGYLDLDSKASYASSAEYMRSLYHTKDLFDWDLIFKISFVDKKFTDYVAERMEYFSQYTTEQRELLHGDFGADNVFAKDGAVSAIIDWEKMRCGDHFLDVGRVLLFCPNREATTRAAVDFYKAKDIKNWKERAAMGIYHVVLTNYTYAALAGNEASCKSSEMRLKELETGLGLV
jgi:hygromycin-B 4-O-kinase